MSEPITKRSKKFRIWDELQGSREQLAQAKQLEVILRERLSSLEREVKQHQEQTKFSIDRQKRLTSENERLHLLIGLTQDLSALDTDRILATTVQKIPTILRAKSISIYIYDEDRGTLVLKDTNHARNIDPLVDVNKSHSSLMALAVRTRQTLIVNNVAQYQGRDSSLQVTFPHQERYGTPSCLVTPVLLGDKVLGVINLADRYDGRPFDRADREAISHVARMMALSLENANKVERLKEAASLDPLTALRNHRAFQELLDIEINRAARYRSDLSIVVLDIKNFGWINGNFGHPAGDAVLVQAARLISNIIRDVDIPARIGGDVFAVFLPEQNLNGALNLVRRMQGIIKDHKFRAGTHSFQAEATFGVVQWTKELNSSEIIRLAETAIQEARRKNEAIGVKT